MRIFLAAADVVMGLILGLFLYVVVSRSWEAFQGPVPAVIVLTASVLAVLFRPSGSLGRRRRQPAAK